MTLKPGSRRSPYLDIMAADAPRLDAPPTAAEMWIARYLSALHPEMYARKEEARRQGVPHFRDMLRFWRIHP